MKRYILNEDGTVSEEPDMLTWARWYETADRTVCSTEFANIWVSTVFLGLDHNFRDDGAPVLFETMAFAKEGADSKIDWSELRMSRYSTIEDARRGHKLICLDVQKIETDAAALMMGLAPKSPVRTE